MEKQLSVIIPSYNVEDTLPKTLDSLLGLNDDDLTLLEVIVVNDGSQDKSLQVAQRYQNHFPAVVRIIDKENGGHGSTINAGIKSATGRYFKIIDGDDFVSSEFRDFLKDLININVDLVMTPYIKEYTNQNKEIIAYPNLENKKTYTYDEVLQRLNRVPDMHSIAYRTNLLRDNHIQLSENCFYVDIQYNVFPIHLIKTVLYWDLPIYRYQLGDENQSVSTKSYLKNKDMHLHVIHSVLTYLDNYATELSDIQKYVIEKLVSGLVSLQINIYLLMDDFKEGKKEYRQMMNHLRNYYPEIYQNPTGYKAKLLRQVPQLFRLLSQWYRRKHL